MSILRYFQPQVIEEYKSKFNKLIFVKELEGAKYITTDDANITQSGRIVKEIWHPVFKKIAKSNKSWLILGFAGGTIAKMISHKYSPENITGVEIDPIMIKVANKYFEIGKIPNLDVVCADANKYIQKTHDHFDYVLVDMYFGATPPEFIYSPDFLKNIKKVGDIVVFNHLFYNPTTQDAAKLLVKRLEPIFTEIKLVRSLANLLLICQ